MQNKNKTKEGSPKNSAAMSGTVVYPYYKTNKQKILSSLGYNKQIIIVDTVPNHNMVV